MSAMQGSHSLLYYDGGKGGVNPPGLYESSSNVVTVSSVQYTKKMYICGGYYDRHKVVAASVTALVCMLVVITCSVLALATNDGSPSSSSTTATNASFATWCTGACSSDSTVSSTEAGVIIGGGGPLVPEAMLWQIKNANGGDYLILRGSDIGQTEDLDGWMNPVIYSLALREGCALSSVRTVQFLSREASTNAQVLAYIAGAEAIWFAGGDQSDYIDFWAGTPVQALLNDKLANITIGGTSAGAAILGGRAIFSSSNGTVDSYTAMADPFGPLMQLVPPLLAIPFLGSFVTDTHFVTRNRMGRMLTFIARIIADAAFSPAYFSTKGVGVDESTALLLNTTSGLLRIVGNNTAYICSGLVAPPQSCSAGVPLTYSNVSCIRLDGAERSSLELAPSLSRSRSAGAIFYCNNVTSGHISSQRYGPGFNYSARVNDDDYYVHSYTAADWAAADPAACPSW